MYSFDHNCEVNVDTTPLYGIHTVWNSRVCKILLPRALKLLRDGLFDELSSACTGVYNLKADRVTHKPYD